MKLNKPKIRLCEYNKVSHGTCSCICMQMNAVPNIVLQLHLEHVFISLFLNKK